MELTEPPSNNEEEVHREQSIFTLMQMHRQEVDALANPPKNRRGSTSGRHYTFRNHNLAAQRLEKNFFNEGCTFNTPKQFKEVFRVSKKVFEKIYKRLKEHPLFIWKFDALGTPGIHPLVKASIAFRFLSYGCPVKALDETFYLGIQTAFSAIEDFCTAMNEIFGATYLRAANNNDIKMILADADERGWPGCLGSVDCTTWRWEMCPVAWQGQYTGKDHKSTVQMEALCGHDGWLWNYVFGLAGGFNNLTVLEHSNIFKEFCSGKQPPVNFVVNEKPYNCGYYLADGIYQEWASLINSIKRPRSEQQKYFNLCQEATRKDIECVFGQMKKKWQIITRPARFHKVRTMGDVMNTCIILHNMGVHKRCEFHERDFVPDEIPRQALYPEDSFMFKARMQACRSKPIGKALKEDLVAHLWNKKGNVGE